MSEHFRITRNRREFLTDAFCGFGAIAFAAMLQQERAARRDATIRWLPSRRSCRPRPSR